MRKYFFIFKVIILFCFVILSFIVLYYFFYYNQRYEFEARELKVNWMITIMYFIIFFYTLLFLIDFNIYNTIFGFIITIGTLLWIGIYLLEFFKIEPSFWNWSTIRDSAAILCISILSPGFTINIIKYIKNNSNQNREKKVFKNYHIHESFVGILFVSMAFILLIIRYRMIQYEIMKKRLRIFLAIDMILLFLFLFSGSFLMFRDRKDLIRLIFIEIRKYQYENKVSSIFSPITPDSIPFFTSPRILYYPFGILLNSFSVNIFIHGTDFLPEGLFGLTHETIVLLGFILCFIAGGLIGIDWYRLFAKIYPELYQEFESVLKDLKKEAYQI